LKTKPPPDRGSKRGEKLFLKKNCSGRKTEGKTHMTPFRRKEVLGKNTGRKIGSFLKALSSKPEK
jgi:hypothetical protein